MRLLLLLTAAVLVRPTRAQTAPAEPPAAPTVDYGPPRFAHLELASQFVALWNHRADGNRLVCLWGQIARDSGVGSFVQIDSVEPLALDDQARCRGLPAMGIIKLIDPRPGGMPEQLFRDALAAQILYAFTVTRPDLIIVGAMHDTAAATIEGHVGSVTVPRFFWIGRTRVVDAQAKPSRHPESRRV